MNPTLSEQALAIRDKVAAGWCQHLMRDALGNVCSYGAFYDIIGITDTQSSPVYRELQGIVGEQVIVWNDAPGRVQQDVVDAWDEVARRFKERGL